METILQSNLLQTILIIIAILVLAVIIYQIVQSILKVVAVVITLLLLYAGYLVYTGQKIPLSKNAIINHGTSQIELIKKNGVPGIKDMAEKKDGDKLSADDLKKLHKEK